MDMMDLILNGAGGAIIGPLVAQFLGGKHQSLMMRVIAGIVGGLGVGAGADAAGMGAILGSDQTMQMIQSVLEGGLGGGALASLSGMLKKKA
ncbi:MAG: hypothetical protein A3E78_03835 [Alphaproteobacteria bacterium RIFCSPHIGHO2_12_FULL_63_12]|nr:MAG: hypothetical protein A3E78_03835 [Alphaproteobacteria bacterium RIFCSPHIGHO2_12_FULL_63_12]